MFGFERLIVYQKSEQFYSLLMPVFRNSKINTVIKYQLKRSSSSIILNIAEGSGKQSRNDKKNFFAIARGSVNECIATLRILKIEGDISEQQFRKLYASASEIGRILTTLINKSYYTT